MGMQKGETAQMAIERLEAENASLKETARNAFMNGMHRAEEQRQSRMVFETATLKEDDFLHLREGGFFERILKHPEVELYRTSDGTFVMRIPGVGAVQMAAKKR